jgi:F420-dependent oxidoreductase-like protein
MKVGMTLSRFAFPGGTEQLGKTVADVGQQADEAGFDSLWVMDHFFQIGHLGPKTDPMLEAYTTLGYLAGAAKQATLGALVGGVTYREPALVVKAVTTLDVLSGGRAVWGIGAGWNGEEAEALGLPSPIGNSRFERLEEALRIAKQMWSGEQKPFEGEFYKLDETISSPQPVQKPHPTILIGGGGEQKTLRLVAQYADMCNFFAEADLGHKMEVLNQHCRDLGRDFDQIEKSAMAGQISAAAADPQALLSAARRARELGVTHLIFGDSPEDWPGSFEIFCKNVLPELKKL